MGDRFGVPTKLQKIGRNDDYKKSISQEKIVKKSKMLPELSPRLVK